MDEDKTDRASRRGFLAGAAGAVGVLAARAVVGAPPARAANGDPVILGKTDMEETVGMVITNLGSVNGGYVLWVKSTAEGSNALVGEGGVGVLGMGDIHGIIGQTSNPFGHGVLGGNEGNGSGVAGVSTGAQGVGVAGRCDTGIGVQAFTMSGTALDVRGRAKFSRSGKATVLPGRTSVSVNVIGAPLDSETLILATAQSPGSLFVQSAVRTGANSFTINLNSAVPPRGKVSVAWFVVN